MTEGMSQGAGPQGVSADELISELQQKIGRYEVEAVAANLLLGKQVSFIRDLEDKIRRLEAPAPTDK